MSRRILSLLTVFAVAAGLTVTGTGCSDNKSGATSGPSIKGGGGVDPQAPGPAQRGVGGRAIKGND